MPKAILLLSGGLDSTLAGKLLVEAGVEVEALNFTSPFCNCTPKSSGCSAARTAAEQLGVPVRTLGCGDEYLEVVKHPKHGRGRGANPCLDCRIHMFSRAKAHMLETGADFVATGEVLGERPMSQRRQAMETIERESGLQGLVVRPLCGRLFPPTVPEQQGLIRREWLHDIQGRRRLPQLEMASAFGISDYPCPAGGCLLTDAEFAAKFFDLFEHDPGFGVRDATLLRYGRHFRLPGGAKAVVGRNEEENGRIEQLVREDDVLLVPAEVNGPTALCRPGDAASGDSSGDLALVASLVASYVKGGTAIDVVARQSGGPARMFRSAAPADREAAESWRVRAVRNAKTKRQETTVELRQRA